MSVRYDVQIRVRGEWQWAGVEPYGMPLCIARATVRQMRINPYWREIGADGFRVRPVPAKEAA